MRQAYDLKPLDPHTPGYEIQLRLRQLRLLCPARWSGFPPLSVGHAKNSKAGTGLSRRRRSPPSPFAAAIFRRRGPRQSPLRPAARCEPIAWKRCSWNHSPSPPPHKRPPAHRKADEKRAARRPPKTCSTSPRPCRSRAGQGSLLLADACGGVGTIPLTTL